MLVVVSFEAEAKKHWPWEEGGSGVMDGEEVSVEIFKELGEVFLGLIVFSTKATKRHRRASRRSYS